MNRTRSRTLLISAICVVALAVLIGYAIRSKQTAQFAKNTPVASGSELSDRRFQIINLSLGRSGTASIAGLFDRFRSAHEFMLIETLSHILDWREGRLSNEALDAFLLKRDKQFLYEVDSTTVLHLAQDRLVTLFPDAKFLLTIRDGDDWLASTVDLMTYMYQTCSEQKTFGDLQCSELITQTSRLSRSITPFFKEEYYRDVQNIGTNIAPLLPDIAAFWGKSTLATLEALSKLPRDRVFIIRTNNIDSSLDSLAKFAGIEKTELNLNKHHINRGRKTHDFARLIGEDKISGAFQPWQGKVDAKLRELGVD